MSEEEKEKEEEEIRRLKKIMHHRSDSKLKTNDLEFKKVNR